MRIMVVGSQNFRNERRIHRALMNAITGNTEPHVLISGGGRRGAEQVAEDYAQAFDWEIERYRADRDQHGDKAGQIRNEQLIKAKPDVCLAFMGEGSAWAEDAASRAKRAGIPVWRYVQSE